MTANTYHLTYLYVFIFLDLTKKVNEYEQGLLSISSHDIEISDDAKVAPKDFKIVQVGTSTEIITKPANDYIRAFLQDIYDARNIV